MRALRVTAVGASVAGVLLLGGCAAGADLTPVPTVAEEPFVCDGVQQAGAELILGGPVAAIHASGSWGVESGEWTGNKWFGCLIELETGGDPNIQIDSVPPDGAGVWGTDPPTIRRSLSTQPDAHEIVADAPGDGFTFGDGAAGWVCADSFTLVVLDDVEATGRDRTADARSLLISMLPWACGGADAPSAEG